MVNCPILNYKSVSDTESENLSVIQFHLTVDEVALS